MAGSLNPNKTLIWFLTLALANFAEAVSQGRDKAQADARRSTKADTTARQLLQTVQFKKLVQHPSDAATKLKRSQAMSFLPTAK
jgi:high-affinity K+ transport system ATPase subunit B